MKVVIAPIDLILPISNIGMVIMQPYVDINKDDPFRWKGAAKTKQIDCIKKTLNIAKQYHHGCDKTHFTIFPEYAIPGLKGYRQIQEILSEDQWPNGTVVIGGMDALNKRDFSVLYNEENTSVDESNGPDQMSSEEWVNCSIIWVKAENGMLRKWIQLKLVASGPEINVTLGNMVIGNVVYLLSSKFTNDAESNFFTLICFDWIGRVENFQCGMDAVLSEIERLQNNQCSKEVHFVFVIQNNKKPNDRRFLTNTNTFLSNPRSHPRITTDKCTVIFANTAGGRLPGAYKYYGDCSLVFSSATPYKCSACPPSYAVFTDTKRESQNLGSCKDALFRERGACNFSFTIKPPKFVSLDSSDYCLPIVQASVHAIDDNVIDPRVPGRSVPAIVKWINDHLDSYKSLLEERTSHPLKAAIQQSHISISKEIKSQNDDVLIRYMKLGTTEFSENREKIIEEGSRKIPNIDKWDNEENKVLETVTKTLSILHACIPLSVTGCEAHGTVKLENVGVHILDILVVSGPTHEDCHKYAQKIYFGSPHKKILLVSRDREGFPCDAKFKSISTPCKTDDNKDSRFTWPDGNFEQCGYSNLLGACDKSTTLPQLKNHIMEFMGV